MSLFVIAFLFGVVFLQQFSSLPNQWWVYGINACFLIFFIQFRSRIYIKTFSFFALGFAWALWFAQSQLTWSLPKELEGKTLYITGYIASIPEMAEHRSQFLFAIQKINSEYSEWEKRKTRVIHSESYDLSKKIKIGQFPKKLVRLTWQNSEMNLRVGEQWILPVRLKRIHSTQNPGAFDFEAWSLQQGIRANGYVVNKIKAVKLGKDYFSINRVRQYFKDKITENLLQSNTSPWITALAIGERHGISKNNWQILRNTGTNHLMAIAGLHIGFMSAFVYGFVFWCWRRIPRFILILPAQHAASIAALCMAFTYSAMAGFSIPTQRACIMFCVFLIIVLFRRNILAWQAWSIAMLLVLLFNPLSVLSDSFWLSFGSVALIIYGMKGRLSPKGVWWKYSRIQWVIALGLVPFSIWLFQQCSFISFIANSIAIPWVGFLIVPLTLIGCFILLFSPHWGGFVLLLADKLLQYLWIVLTYFADLSWSSWYQAIPNRGIIMGACLGIVVLLLPAGFPGRWLGTVWLLPLFLYQAPHPKLGDVWFTLLDVGQGLACVIQTQNHILVFDTGAKLSESYDMGESVVLPYLRTIGAKKIDMLVISHGDNDHRGGANSIIEQMPVKSIKTSVPEGFSANASLCLKGESWQWDNIKFEFLYPSRDQLGLGNDSSCVLKVSRGAQAILLTGDIEKYAEKVLLGSVPESLSATILVAPHHGSKTSGVTQFIKKVNPEVVLFPIGYRNRYHFPHPSVVKKYREANVTLYDSAASGAIQFKLESANVSLPTLYRLEHKRYWYDSSQ